MTQPPEDPPLDPRLTDLLVKWSEGDRSAMEELMPLVCNDLRAMARKCLAKESERHLLQPTALVNEFFLKIHKSRTVHWTSRAHFFGSAAQTMRNILVDFARHKNRAKRNQGESPMMLGPELDEVSAVHPDTPPPAEILALHQVLERLEAKDARMATVVELRYFVGMTVEETAAAMDLSPATVKREWQFARLWLYRELHGDGEPSK